MQHFRVRWELVASCAFAKPGRKLTTRHLQGLDDWVNVGNGEGKGLAWRQTSPASLSSRAGSSDSTAAPSSAPRNSHTRKSPPGSPCSLTPASFAGVATSHASPTPLRRSGEGVSSPSVPPSGRACDCSVTRETVREAGN